MPRRKRTYRRKTNATTRKIARVARAVVNRAIETKEKRYDYSSVGIDPVGGSAVTFGSISYGGSACIAQLCRGITRGTNDGERVGHQIILRGIYINLAVQCASATEQNYVRFAVIRPKGQISTTSIASLTQQVFSNQASSATQWLNPIDTDIFNVYMDKQKFIKPTDISGVGSPSNWFLRRFIKFPKGIPIKWSESDSQPARDFYLVAISDSAAISHPGAVAGFIRLYYKD